MGHIVLTIDDEANWHKERSKGLGGSDIAAILGLNPYKTNVDLWREKTGRKKPEDISQKPAVLYGKKAEDYMRELFKLDYPEYDVTHRPYDIHIKDGYDFIRASLDGELLEISTQIIGIYEGKTTTVVNKKEWQKWENRIPNNYYCQVLHYLLIDDDYKFCKLKAKIRYKKDDEIAAAIRHYTILRKECESDINLLFDKECEFYWHIKNDKEPPLKLPEI